MTRPPRLEHLTAAVTSGLVTMRPGRLRAGQPYLIDARDPAVIAVYFAHDLTPSEKHGILEQVDADLRPVLRRRRRRADLAAVTELVGDEALDEATGTDAPFVDRDPVRLSVVR